MDTNQNNFCSDWLGAGVRPVCHAKKLLSSFFDNALAALPLFKF